VPSGGSHWRVPGRRRRPGPDRPRSAPPRSAIRSLDRTRRLLAPLPEATLAMLPSGLRGLIGMYLAGRMALEGTELVDESDLPGPLGRVLLASLALSRGPVSRVRLASIMWDGELPDQYERSLNPLLSKLRRRLVAAGGDNDLLVSGGGAVELRR